MAVYGRGVAYRPYNWAVFAAHCRLKDSERRWAPNPWLTELFCESAVDCGKLYVHHKFLYDRVTHSYYIAV